MHSLNWPQTLTSVWNTSTPHSALFSKWPSLLDVQTLGEAHLSHPHISLHPLKPKKTLVPAEKAKNKSFPPQLFYASFSPLFSPQTPDGELWRWVTVGGSGISLSKGLYREKRRICGGWLGLTEVRTS